MKTGLAAKMAGLTACLTLAGGAAARPPKLTDVGVVHVRPDTATRPTAFVVISPPQLPPVAVDALPEAARGPYQAWLHGIRALREAAQGPTPGTADVATRRVLEAEADRSAAGLAAALKGHEPTLSGAAWAVLGQVEWELAALGYAQQFEATERCLAEGRDPCPEPPGIQADAAHSAWGRVTAEAGPALLSWCRNRQGRLDAEDGRDSAARDALRQAAQVVDAPTALRADAALQLGELLARDLDLEALAWLDLAAPSPGDLGLAARLLRLRLNASLGDAAAAAREGLGWPSTPGLATDTRPEVLEVTAGAVARLGSGAPALLDQRCRADGPEDADAAPDAPRFAPGACADVLVRAAELLLDGGIAIWARAQLDAADSLVARPSAAATAVRARLPSDARDDARAWAERVAHHCRLHALRSPLGDGAVITLTPGAAGKATATRAGAHGQPMLLDACLATPPPPEAKGLGRVRFRLVFGALMRRQCHRRQYHSTGARLARPHGHSLRVSIVIRESIAG